jgi:hypothetical protein
MASPRDYVLDPSCIRCRLVYEPRAVGGASLTVNGQSFVFYMRASGCPFCGCTTVRVDVRKAG